MKDDKWVQRWVVPSSSGGGDYIVGRTSEGEYGCSCPGWVKHYPRRDCKHILEVRAGGGRTLVEATIDKMKGR